MNPLIIISLLASLLVSFSHAQTRSQYNRVSTRNGEITNKIEYDSKRYSQVISARNLKNGSRKDPFENPIDLTKVKEEALRLTEQIDSKSDYIIQSIMITKMHDAEVWYALVRIHKEADTRPAPGFSLAFALDGNSGEFEAH